MKLYIIRLPAITRLFILNILEKENKVKRIKLKFL